MTNEWMCTFWKLPTLLSVSLSFYFAMRHQSSGRHSLYCEIWLTSSIMPLLQQLHLVHHAFEQFTWISLFHNISGWKTQMGKNICHFKFSYLLHARLLPLQLLANTVPISVTVGFTSQCTVATQFTAQFQNGYVKMKYSSSSSSSLTKVTCKMDIVIVQ